MIESRNVKSMMKMKKSDEKSGANSNCLTLTKLNNSVSTESGQMTFWVSAEIRLPIVTWAQVV